MFTAKAEELKTYPFTLPKVDEAEAGKCADKDAATTCFVDGNTLLVDLGTEQTVSSFHYLPDQSEYNKGPGGEQRGILEHQEQSDSPIGLLQSGNSQICAVESSADGGK